MTVGDKAFKALEDAGLDNNTFRKVDIALMNSRDKGIAMMRQAGAHDAADQFVTLGNTLDDIAAYIKPLGLGAGLRKGYMPRQVDDISHFESIKEVNTYLESLARKKGISLTEFDKQTAITDLMNDAFSRSNDIAFGRAARNLKKRGEKVTEENYNAYSASHQAYNNYAEDVARQAERRRFFKGAGVNVDDLGVHAENIEGVAANLAKALARGDENLSTEQLDEIRSLIVSRFGPGEQASSRGVQNFKNFTYTGLLANPIAAMTQFGDIALSAYRNGIRNTTVSVVKNLASGGKGVNGLSKQEALGLRHAAADFNSRVGSRDMLEWGLKYSGFRTADNFGKNVFLHAAMRRNSQMSKADFMQKWAARFDPDAKAPGQFPRTEKLWNDVQNFEKTGLTNANREDIGLMSWNELADVQPIGLSALPQAYMDNPNGRMLYMLKSFTLRLFDVMRKDIVNQVAAKNYGAAMRNTAKLSTLFVGMNGTVDMAKAFVLGKDVALPDVILNQYLKMLGGSKWTADTISRKGLGDAGIDLVAPPMAIINGMTDGKVAAGLIPIAGRSIQSQLK